MSLLFQIVGWGALGYVVCLVLSGIDPITILVLGPLHTRAKSCDHEIVRAQKKVSKGCPKTPPKSCSVVTDSQV